MFTDYAVFRLRSKTYWGDLLW